MNDNFSYNIHESYMERALELAKEGIGSVSPNPLVGCILVKNGEIIGEGFHEKYGNSHAEIIAYKNSIKDPTDSTMYVTLEPCCFEGKTPACTKFIIENISKLKKVNWIIKQHPYHDYFKPKIDFNEEIINLVKKFEHIKLLPENIDPSSLLKIADTALTTSGSVGIEYPAFGVIPSLNFSPFIRLNVPPRYRAEYDTDPNPI